jgi:hypothetical protein
MTTSANSFVDEALVRRPQWPGQWRHDGSTSSPSRARLWHAVLRPRCETPASRRCHPRRRSTTAPQTPPAPGRCGPPGRPGEVPDAAEKATARTRYARPAPVGRTTSTVPVHGLRSHRAVGESLICVTNTLPACRLGCCRHRPPDERDAGEFGFARPPRW